MKQHLTKWIPMNSPLNGQWLHRRLDFIAWELQADEWNWFQVVELIPAVCGLPQRRPYIIFSRYSVYIYNRICIYIYYIIYIIYIWYYIYKWKSRWKNRDVAPKNVDGKTLILCVSMSYIGHLPSDRPCQLTEKSPATAPTFIQQKQMNCRSSDTKNQNLNGKQTPATETWIDPEWN